MPGGPDSRDQSQSCDHVVIQVDGAPVEARAGQTVAGALLGLGRRTLRHTRRAGRPRGIYCAIGICFDCLVQLDGGARVRACQQMVRSGLRISTGLPTATDS